MARPLGGASTEVIQQTTDPFFLVELGFNTPIYLSSRQQYSWNSKTWVPADMQVSVGKSTSLSIFNEDGTLGSTILSEGTSGRSVKIWQVYGSTELPVFAGEMGESNIGNNVNIACRRHPPLRTPRLIVGAPVFNHLPKRGTKFETPNGTVTLE